MRCEQVRRQLATYRELSAVERQQVRQHLDACPACAALWEVYQAQDDLLSSLPELRPSAELTSTVLDRTVRSAIPGRATRKTRGVRGFRSRAASVAVVGLLVLFVTLGGTIPASAGALPGEILYPVKLATEQVRLALTWDDSARLEYQESLAETRRGEAREIVKLEREAEVRFEGHLEAVDEGVWIIDGLQVEVAPETWGAEAPQVGSVVVVKAQAAGGRLAAEYVGIKKPQVAKPTITLATYPYPAPGRSPTSMPGRTELPGPTASPSLQEPTKTALRPERLASPYPLVSPSLPEKQRTKRVSETPGASLEAPTREATPTREMQKTMRAVETRAALRTRRPTQGVATQQPIRTRELTTPTANLGPAETLKPSVPPATRWATRTPLPVVTRKPPVTLEPDRTPVPTMLPSTRRPTRTPPPQVTRRPTATKKPQKTRQPTALPPTPRPTRTPLPNMTGEPAVTAEPRETPKPTSLPPTPRPTRTPKPAATPRPSATQRPAVTPGTAITAEPLATPTPSTEDAVTPATSYP